MAKKECPEGKEISPFSGNCVKKCKTGQTRSDETGRCRNNPNIARKKCPEGKEISAISGNCVKKCKKNQKRNKSTGRCRKTKTTPKHKTTLKRKPNIPRDKYITMSGGIETRVNVGRSVEFTKMKNICAKTNTRLCKIVDKYNLLPDSYFVSKKLGEGVHGKTYLLCNKNTQKCDRVIKYSSKASQEDFQNEAIMHKYFYKAGLAPEFLGGTYLPKEKEFVIIMGRIDSTLEEYLAKKLTKKEISKVFDKLEKLLNKMHRHNLLHADFHAGNIGLIQQNKTIKPYVIDFGFSKIIPRKCSLTELDYLQLYRTVKFNNKFKATEIHTDNFSHVKKLIDNIYIKRFGKDYFNKHISNRSFQTINTKFLDLHDELNR